MAMRHLPKYLAAAALLWTNASIYAETAFDNPVDDATLASSYGKYLASNGIDLAMSVQSDTAVNGHLVLRSVFTVDQGPATLQVYAPAAGTSGPTVTLSSGTGTAQSNPAGNQGVSVSVDRSTGTAITAPTGGSASSGVSVSTGTASSTGNDGLTAVQASATGVQTGAGVVSVTPGANGSRITLDGAGLSISHLVGAATGTIIANTGNDRTINTVTNVQIDVRNAPALAAGSAMVRIDALATATRAMMR